MQSALAAWPGLVSDAAEDELNAINLIEMRLLPYLDPLVQLGPMFDYRVGPGFSGPAPDPIILMNTTQLKNILGRRRQHGILAAIALRQLLDLQMEIQRLLSEELRS